MQSHHRVLSIAAASALLGILGPALSAAQTAPPADPKNTPQKDQSVTPGATPAPAPAPSTAPASDKDPKTSKPADADKPARSKSPAPAATSPKPPSTPGAQSSIADRLEPGSTWVGKDKDGDTFTVKVTSRTPSQNSAKLSVKHTTGRDHFDMEVTYTAQAIKVVSVTRHVRSTGHMSTDSTPSVQLSIDAQNTLRLSGKAEFDAPSGKRKNLSVPFNVTCQPGADDEENAPKKKRKGN